MPHTPPLQVRFPLCCAVVVLAATLAAPSLADITASTYSGGGTVTTFTRSDGWAFIPSATITVTQLGVWDANGDGLSVSHLVGLFQGATQTTLIFTSVPSGVAAPLTDGSRFVDITPTVLNAGVEYYILADGFTADEFAYGNTAISYAPGIDWVTTVNGASPSIFSTPHFLNDGIRGDLGPNFRFVPAPGSLVALALMVGVYRSRQRR